MPLELLSVAEAAQNATTEELAELRRLLALAGENLDDDAVLTSVNIEFHRQIARASCNTVLEQFLGVVHDLFTAEQRAILGVFGSRERDHLEHVGIFEAIEQRNEALAVERIRAHLQGALDAVQRWNPDEHPVGRAGARRPRSARPVHLDRGREPDVRR